MASVYKLIAAVVLLYFAPVTLALAQGEPEQQLQTGCRCDDDGYCPPGCGGGGRTDPRPPDAPTRDPPDGGTPSCGTCPPDKICDPVFHRCVPAPPDRPPWVPKPGGR
jgi:hypothetical protein